MAAMACSLQRVMISHLDGVYEMWGLLYMQGNEGRDLQLVPGVAPIMITSGVEYLANRYFMQV